MSVGNPFLRLVYQNSPAVLQNLMATVYSKRMGQRKFGPRFAEHLADLRRKQWYSQEDILLVQSEKLRRILAFSQEFVPYYRDLFHGMGVKIDAIRKPADLETITTLDKQTLLQRLDRLRSELFQSPARIHAVHSSGSTGTPLSIAVDIDYLQLEKAYLWLQREWCGLKLGDRSAQFSANPIVPVNRRNPPFWIHDRSENRTIFSVRHMSPQNLHAYASQLVSFDPQMIVGYPMAIYLIAAHLNEHEIESVRPRGVFTSSETVYPYQRDAIEKAFGCRVMDLYGHAEYSGMLMQCKLGNYHIQEDYGVIEILKPDGSPAGPGQFGELIATGLNNLAMPLIRYRTGDLAVPKAGRCPCGRCGGLVERVVGRIDDVIVTPEGRMLNRLDSVFREMPNIIEAQLQQESPESLRVRVVPRNNFTEADKALLIRKLREHTGGSLHFDFEVLESIPRRPSGKFQFVVSKVSLDYTQLQQPEADWAESSASRGVD